MNKKAEKRTLIARLIYWKRKKDCCKGFCPSCQYYSECRTDCLNKAVHEDGKLYCKVDEKELLEIKDMIEEGCEASFIVERLEQMIQLAKQRTRYN